MGELLTFPDQRQYGAGLQFAAGAEEMYIVGHAVSPLHVHEEASSVLEAATAFNAINADKTPWLRGIRAQVRAESEDILEANRQKLRDGHFEDVHLDVDALGTAAKIAAIGREHGINSVEYQRADRGLLVDCQRKYAEAFRINTWEYFGEITQQYDPKSNKLFADGLPVDQMIDNGLTPVAVKEEADRRINDRVNLATTKEILKSQRAEEVAVIRIQPCPQYALDAYKKDPKGAHGGYAPGIDKLMVDFDWFNSDKQEVSHEQIGVSGTYISPEVITETLRIIGVLSSPKELSRTEIHATVGIVDRNQITQAADVQRILDQIASERSGKNIYMGEVVADDFKKDYDRIHQEAAERQSRQTSLAEELAAYTKQLEAQNVDHAPATMMVEDFVQSRMLKVAELDPSQAEAIFDKETADGFKEVHNLRSQGRYEEADRLRLRVEQAAPPAGSCGTEGCGLEIISATSQEGAELAKKLKAEAGDKIVKDKIRRCKCGHKSIVYAYSATKVNKYCTNCDAFESTITAA